MKCEVRIAVVIDANGKWNAAGWEGALDDEMKAEAEHRNDWSKNAKTAYIVKAHLAIPSPTVVKGMVEP